MNKYPVWKYVLIAVAILVGIVYAAPNLFGEIPVVQVSGARASFKVDPGLRSDVSALAAKGCSVLLNSPFEVGEDVFNSVLLVEMCVTKRRS